MIVTINTDASFSRKHQVGTFAFWIVCDRFKILKSGRLRKQITRPEIAEFKCIINAMHVLLNENISDIHQIVINTDCLNVIHLIERDKKNINRYGLKSWGQYLVARLDLLRMEKKAFHIPIKMKHVKSHTGIGDARSWVNEWCDTQAKAEMNKLVGNFV